MNWEDLDVSDCLFRYRGFDEGGRSIEALKQRRLYFSSPAMFNDPYDSLVFARADKTWREMSRNIILGMDRYLENIKYQVPEEAFITYQLWKTNPELSLQQTYEMFHNGLKLVRNMIRNNTKVICFSESYDSMLMWAHYADYHKGFALMYKKDEIQESSVFSVDGERIGNSVRIEPVAYVEKQLDLTNDVGWYVRENITPKDSTYKPVDKSVGVMKIRRVLLEKSKEWSYEKEWRVTERLFDEGDSCWFKM